jgi:hypothetical protein
MADRQLKGIYSYSETQKTVAIELMPNNAINKSLSILYKLLGRG